MEKAFKEIQKYPGSSYILIVPLLIVLMLFVFSVDVWFQLFLGSIVLVLALSLLYVFTARFIIEINSSGVSYQVTPFGKKQYISKNDITNIEVINLDFIGTFRGWGARKRKGKKAYIFNDGDFLFIKTSEMSYYFSIKDSTVFFERIPHYFVDHTAQ